MKKSEINILIVEDDASLRETLGTAVKKFGYTPVLAGRVDEALSAVKLKPIHAAVIDCLLPKMNGVDLAIKMRESRFGNAPIILMSGIFRDRAFESDARSKTQAIEFLHKPFDIGIIQSSLQPHLAELFDTGQMPLNVLVSKPFSTPRERTKIIEALEEINGYDLPFVLSILMDSQVKGHLNLVNSDQEIYGITLHSGFICKVDSSEALATLSMMLLQKGFVSADDLKALSQEGGRGDILAELIERSLISPHAVPILKNGQMIEDLKRVILSDKLNVNFVPDRKLDEKAEGLNLEALTPIFHEIAMADIPMNYFKSFFSDWYEFPIRLGTGFSESHTIFNLSIFKNLSKLSKELSGEPTLEELMKAHPGQEEMVYHAIYVLSLRRLVIFDDVKRTKSVAESAERMKVILKEIQGKNPFKVFEYFGAAPNANIEEVMRVYKEFAKENHPDTLAQNVEEEIKAVYNGVFQIVSAAYEILSNEKKRAHFLSEIKQKEAEKEIKAEALAEEALVILRRGRAKEALVKLKEAYGIYPSRMITLYHCWALLKAAGEMTPLPVITEVSKMLEKIPFEQRRNALFYHVSGLLKKAQGDLEGAGAQFDRGLMDDPDFIDSRRELSLLKGEADSKTKNSSSIFTGDISQIVSGLFKKKTK